MYAIVRSGGKQHRVEEGRSFTVELLPVEEGAQVELNDVLLIADDGQVTIGTPTIEGARVLTQVEAQGRHKKIIVFKYKSKVRTRKKTGHRQHFTRLTVQEILRPGQEPKAAEKPKRRRRKKTEEVPEEIIKTAVESATVEAPEAPAPKRRTRRKTPAAETTPKPRTRRKAPAAETTPKPRTRRKTPKAEAGTAEATAAEASKPKRRTRRKTPQAEAGTAETTTAGEAEEKPKRRRSPRRKASDESKETE
ncbi:MAG: 50S ribosomal protein L21 [Chloroflexi bacterium]|nr:50S ribosomal protein L21 [Chloroflexota bacterium]